MYPSYTPRPARPIGVTVLTILQILNGLGEIIIGSLLLILALIAGVLIGGLLVTVLFLIDFFVIALGIFSFALAYGLWTRKGWAWILSMIGAIIGIILGVLTLTLSLAGGSGIIESLVSLVPIILYVLILVYLSTRNVRAFFGRTGGMPLASRGQPYAPYTQPYPQPAVQQPYYQQGAWGGISCPNCGSPSQAGAGFCDRCGTRLR